MDKDILYYILLLCPTTPQLTVSEKSFISPYVVTYTGYPNPKFQDRIYISHVEKRAYNSDCNSFHRIDDLTYEIEHEYYVAGYIPLTKDNLNEVQKFGKFFWHTSFFHIIKTGTTKYEELHIQADYEVINDYLEYYLNTSTGRYVIPNVAKFMDDMVLISEDGSNVWYFNTNLNKIFKGSKDYSLWSIMNHTIAYASSYPCNVGPEIACATYNSSYINEDKRTILDETYNSKEEHESMFDNLFKKYSFGKITSNALAYTMQGLAFRDSAGDYIVYKDGKGTNVGQLTIDVPLFKMPAPLSEVKAGDIIVNYAAGNECYVLVEEVKDNGITVIDPYSKSRVEMIPETNLFGFNFIVKVFCPINVDTIKADETNPFGNLLPLMMMSEGGNNEFLPFLLMRGQGQTEINPMFLMFMMDNGGKNDLMKYYLMSQMIKPIKVVQEGPTIDLGEAWKRFYETEKFGTYKVEIGDNPGHDPQITC